ncbi:MAG: hypothetical protein KJ941_08750 [Bacteroidetes bacterium]|nr:hypothetical protein [Bacteroidota bacterium]
MRESFLKGSSLIICSLWLLLQWSRYTVPIDCGDGIMHFFISEASWQNPLLFLHHWGKPFFILLSSPFAQFGMSGLVVFNVLIFAGTVFIGWRILKKLDTPLLLQLLLPFFLVYTKDYTETIIGGLTEPLFSFVLVLGTWSLMHKKWTFFAFFIGLLPFCRSEGQLLILIAIPILLYYKQWKTILFLFVPFFIYSIVGLIAQGEFWWYFTQSPYSMDNAIYGSGAWNHYFISYKNYLGNHGLFSLALALVLFFTLLIKKGWSTFNWPMLFLLFSGFIGVLFAHSYFWANGLNGSMGLTRITTQGLPSLLIGSLYIIGRFKIEFSRVYFFQIGLFLFLTVVLVRKFEVNPGVTEGDQAVLDATKLLKKNKAERHHTLYHHPLFAYTMDYNSLLPDKKSRFYYHRGTIADMKSNLKHGDIITWDGHFGPREMNLPFDSLYLDSEIVLIQNHEIKGPLFPTGFFVFQYVPATFKLSPEKLRIDHVIYNQIVPSSTDEFIPIYKKENLNSTLQLELNISGSSDEVLVFATKNGAYYRTFPLNKTSKIRALFTDEEEIVMYVWNRSRTPLKEVRVKVVEFSEKLHPLYSN